MNPFHFRRWNLETNRHHIIIQHFWQVRLFFVVVWNRIVDVYELDYLGALNQAKIDVEQLHENRSSYSSVHWHQNTVHNDPNRLLFVLLGIVLVGLIFGATVLFFQRMYVLLIELIHSSFSVACILVVVIVIQNYSNRIDSMHQHELNY